MSKQWQELKETIVELRDGDGTGTQQEVCKFLANYMDILEKQMQEICEYCHEDRDGYVIPLEKNSHAFIRYGMNGWELSLRAKGWHGSAKIKYCPMCGRELKNG